MLSLLSVWIAETLVWINVTTNPTAEWVARQITEAFPWNEAPRYLIRDRDGIYGAIVTRRLRAMGIRDKPIAPASPWQNGYAERLIGSIRRECLDAGGCRDVLESTATDVLPKLVAANLADKVDVRQTISIDIRDRHAIAMIVVSRFVGLAGVVDDAVPERDAAPRQLVCELKVVKRADTGSRLDLRGHGTAPATAYPGDRRGRTGWSCRLRATAGAALAVSIDGLRRRTVVPATPAATAKPNTTFTRTDTDRMTRSSL